LSIPDPADSPDNKPALSRLKIAMRVVALFAAIVSVGSLWLSERARVVDDLQLSAEAAARPGESLALRAFYLRDVDAPAGPELQQTDVFVRLLDAQQRQIAETSLMPAADGETMEGALQVPAAEAGTLLIEARAQLAQRAALKVVRPLAVQPDAPLLAPRFREAQPLQQLSVGTLRMIAGGGDLSLSPRIVGGTCIPELPCTVLVWMGGAGAQLRVRGGAAITAKPPEPAGETAGLVAAVLTVHGPEAVLTLEAWRAGQLLVERTLRLPVALGETQLTLSRALLASDEPAVLAASLPPGRSHAILDVFPGGRWTRSHAFDSNEAERLRLPEGSLRPGLVRFQVHTDKFAGEGAATRLAYVRRPSESLGDALLQLLREAHAADLSDPLTDGWLAELPEALLRDSQRAASYMLAAFELQRTPLPRAVSGRPRELQRLSRAQTGLRFGVGAVLTLSALVVGMTLMRRGLSAQREAEAILDEGERESGSERNRAEHSSVAFVVSLVLVVSLAFLAAALLIIAKPLWF
jgi:hypothetical protein